ncbi:MAG TPA: hypothetical protein DHW82_06575 [Spirochaetia bacterium]|nr:hypothetical protein [Spirochaetia bacterium]
MKKQWIRLAVLLVLFLGLFFSIYIKRDTIKNDPFHQYLPFNIYLLAGDSKNNVYIADKGGKRLIKMNSNGEILFQKNGERDEKKHFSEIWEMTVDQNDNLYVLDIQTNLERIVLNERIIQYRPNGEFEKIIYENPHSEDEQLLSENLLFSLQIEGDLFLCLKKNKENKEYKNMTLVSVNLLTGEAKDEMTLDIPDEIIKLIGSQSGSIFYTTKKGKLWTIDETREHKPLLTETNPFFVPGEIFKDSKGNLFLNDYGKQTIFKIPKKGAVLPFISKNNIAGKTLFQPSYLVQKTDTLLVANSMNGYQIYSFDSDGKIQFTIEKGQYSKKFLIMQWLYYLQFLLAAVILGFAFRIIYIYFIKKRTSLVIKFILIFTPFFMGSIYITSKNIYDDVYKRYRDELFEKLSVIAQTGKNIVSGDLFEKITLPEHFLNDDYQRLKGEIYGSILNQNRDTWNKSLYILMFKKIDHIVYYMADSWGYYGVMKPYPNATKMHYQVFDKDEIFFSQYADNEGEYLGAVTQIRNSKGEMVGIMEVGINFSVINEMNQEFENNLIKGILYSILVYWTILVLFIFILLISLRVLKKGVQKVASGDWDVQIKVKSNDEIGELGKGFNQMTRQIQEYFELKKHTAIVETRNSILQQEMKLARQIQLKLIPQTSPESETVSFSSLYKPMDEIGGHLYDFIQFRETVQIGIFISDVSGHGIPAALITSMVKSLIQASGSFKNHPSQLLTFINDKVTGQISENFLTAFYGIYDEKTKVLTYARASHNYPFLIRGNEITFLKSKGFMLGMRPNITFQESSVELQSGDKVLFYTDGLTEAMNQEGQEFSEIINDYLLEYKDLPIEDFVNNIYGKLIEYTGTENFEDDVCMVGMEVK